MRIHNHDGTLRRSTLRRSIQGSTWYLERLNNRDKLGPAPADRFRSFAFLPPADHLLGLLVMVSCIAGPSIACQLLLHNNIL